MRLIVTRPEEDARSLAEKLQRLGHEAIMMPLIEIAPVPGIAVPLLPWQALCFTSANGPRCHPATDALKHLPVFTVGPQSRAEAQHQGYMRVQAHGGDVNGLAHYMVTHLKPDAGPILYLSGTETSGDLEGKLRHRGFTVHRTAVYQAKPCVPPGLKQEISIADGVLLYSPRTTLHWLAALAASHAETEAAALRHYCLSANVAAKLPRHFGYAVAATPDEGGMLALIDDNA